jgi:hypothetical protein
MANHPATVGISQNAADTGSADKCSELGLIHSGRRSGSLERRRIGQRDGSEKIRPFVNRNRPRVC